MNIALKFFWLVCALWAGVGSALFFRFRLRAAVVNGAISKKEADRFVSGTVAWIGAPCLVFLGLQFLADSASPDFLTWVSPYSHIARILCVLLWITSFFWIWFLGGDRKLARVFTLAHYQTDIWKHPVAFRIAVVLMIASGVAGMIAHQKMS